MSSLSARALRTSARRSAQGVDLDLKAFGEKTFPKPKPIDTAPFYAVQFFPITRKSIGGVDVDLDCRVLDKSGKPIPGLYAVGEGFGGINGKAALEGTFLGPAIYMGPIARELAPRPSPQPFETGYDGEPVEIIKRFLRRKNIFKIVGLPKDIFAI